MKNRYMYCFGLITLTLACAPISFVKKKSSKEMADTLAAGRRVTIAPSHNDFSLVDYANVGSKNQAAAVASRQKAYSGTSKHATWVLLDPETSQPVEKDQLAENLKLEIETHYEDYGIRTDELASSPLYTAVSERLLAVSFQRYYNNTLVRDAFIQGIYWLDDSGFYRLREVVNESYGEIQVNNALALASTWADLKAVLPDENITPISSRRVILAVKKSNQEDSQSELISHIYASEFKFEAPDDSGTLTVTLEDGSLVVVEGYSSKYQAAMPIAANVFKRTYLENAQVQKSLFETPVMIQNNNQLTSDIDGLVDIGDATSVTLRLQSRRVSVLPRQGNVPVQITATPAIVNGNLVITSTGDNLTALNTYTSVIEVNRFIKRHMLESESAFLSQATPVRFNVRGNCNAFYDSQASAISLFAAGNGCANVALINDVTYHEWGHGLDNFTGVNVGITDGAFSEAIGDIIAAYLTGSPVTAPGFLLNDPTGIRNLDNQKVYPGSLQNQVHADGEIVGGAFWHMRQAFIGRYGANAGAIKAENLFVRHLLTTDSYLRSYESVLRLDDQDGNPMTKSQNHCLINAAFAMHGLATAENCQDDATVALPIDNTAAIAVLKTSEQGVTLMASTEKGTKMALCFEAKEICLAKADLQVELLPEGVMGQKVFFVTKDPLPALKPLSTATLIIKGQDGKPVSTRSFKLSLK